MFVTPDIKREYQAIKYLYEPIVERAWEWTMGLLLASELVVCGRSVMAAVVEVAMVFPVKLEVDVEDGFVVFNDFEDHELHVSQPSAERVDSRQQDHRFPLHNPAW